MIIACSILLLLLLILPSVFFRVNPWQMLLHLLSSVSLLLLILLSVYFRVNPWLCFFLAFLPWLMPLLLPIIQNRRNR